METDKPNGANNITGSKIEDALDQGALEEGFDRFDDLIKMIEGVRSDVSLLVGSLNSLRLEDSRSKLEEKTVSLERNRIRHGFYTQLDALKRALPQYLDMSRPELMLRGRDNQHDIIQKVIEARLRGHYNVLHMIKAGNSALVFKLSDIFTNRLAVAKVMKVPELTAEIKEEVGAVSELKHRNLIKLYGERFESFPFFIICEHVDGLVISEVIEKTGPRPVSQALGWLVELCDVLDYLGQRNIAHSNIRPSKIFIDREYHPMISPFDIIKAGMDDRTLSRFREDCQYFSPELLESDGQRLDKRAMKTSDQFTLGLVAYKIVTGNDLFQGDSVKEIIENRNRFLNPKNKAYRKELLSALGSPELIRLIDKTLQEDPKRRFKDLHLLRTEFRDLKAVLQKQHSAVRKSYIRCLVTENQLVNTFYENLFVKLPNLKEHFMDPRRQAYMFQMAVDTLLEDRQNTDHLIGRVTDNTHKHFSLSMYDTFLGTFIQTIKDLHLAYQYEWSDQLQADWDNVKKQSLSVIEYALSHV